MGLLAAFAVTRLMASILIGVSTTDFVTFGGISLLLSLIALGACYFRRARDESNPCRAQNNEPVRRGVMAGMK